LMTNCRWHAVLCVWYSTALLLLLLLSMLSLWVILLHDRSHGRAGGCCDQKVMTSCKPHEFSSNSTC